MLSDTDVSTAEAKEAASPKTALAASLLAAHTPLDTQNRRSHRHLCAWRGYPAWNEVKKSPPKFACMECTIISMKIRRPVVRKGEAHGKGHHLLRGSIGNAEDATMIALVTQRMLR